MHYGFLSYVQFKYETSLPVIPLLAVLETPPALYHCLPSWASGSVLVLLSCFMCLYCFVCCLYIVCDIEADPGMEGGGVGLVMSGLLLLSVGRLVTYLF